MVLSPKNLTISVIFSIALIYYFNIYTPLVRRFDNAQRKVRNKMKSTVTEIVAYSLLKNIEIKNQEFICEELRHENGTIKVKNGGREGTDISDDLWVQIDGTNLFVYSVYLDTRLDPFHYIRILGMIRGKWSETFYCQILTNEHTHRIIKADVIKIWSQNWNINNTTTYYNPILASCLIPLKKKARSISLSKIPCTLSSSRYILKSDEIKKKNEFTICIKPLNFEQDVSTKLFYWLEMNIILGANKFDIYIEKISEKVLKFLRWYQRKADAQINLYKHENIKKTRSKITLKEIVKEGKNNQALSTALESFIWQKRRYEILAYNDCFYRNLHSTDYILPIDVDEIIVPRGVRKWSELLNKTVNPQLQEEFASFTVQNAYYLHGFTDIRSLRKQKRKLFPSFFQDVVRSEFSAKGESGKSFVSTRNALTVFNHYALEVLKPGVKRNYFLSSKDVQMNHYKKTCSVFILPQCDKYVSSHIRILDPVILKYQDEFYRRIENFCIKYPESVCYF